MAKTSNDTAWGLEFGGSALRLVRVTRNDAGYRADSFLEVPLPDRWENSVDLVAAVGQMTSAKVTGPLFACMSDQQILFRTLSLPKAQAPVLERIVQGQLEVLIPTHADRFTGSFLASDDPFNPSAQRVLLCAVRKDALDEILRPCKRLTRQPDGVTPSILALAALSSRLDSHTKDPIAVLDVAARSTSIALLLNGQITQCAVFDSAADRWTERIAETLDIPYSQAEQRKQQLADSPDSDHDVHNCLRQALDDWADQLRDFYQHCLDQLPQDRRPIRCILFGRAAQTPGLSALISDALSLPVEKPAVPSRLSLDQDMDFSSSAAAIGSAISALETDWPVVNLAAPPKKARPLGRKLSLWRWAGGFVWLLAALLTLYGLDKAEAYKLTTALSDLEATMAEQGGLSRQLALGDYLYSVGPSPLDAMDRITASLPNGIMLAAWSHSSTGQVTIRGTVANEKDFQTMYDKLCELASVDFRSGKPEGKKKFRFEFRLSIPRDLAAAKKPEAEEKTADSAEEAKEEKPTEPEKQAPQDKQDKTEEKAPEPAAESTPAPPEELPPTTETELKSEEEAAAKAKAAVIKARLRKGVER